MRNTINKVYVFESTVWSELSSPNLLVGLSGDDCAHLLHALLQHKGELQRNAYHLRFPAKMLLRVERGAEQIFGRDSTVPPFLFGDTYIFRLYENGIEKPVGKYVWNIS